MKTKTGSEIICVWCGESFIKRRPNMIYCKKECCNAATNKKLIERYHENKQRRREINRVCIKCDSRLSRYNQDDVCHSCQIKETDSEKIDLLRSLGFSYVDENE